MNKKIFKDLLRPEFAINQEVFTCKPFKRIYNDKILHDIPQETYGIIKGFSEDNSKALVYFPDFNVEIYISIYQIKPITAIDDSFHKRKYKKKLSIDASRRTNMDESTFYNYVNLILNKKNEPIDLSIQDNEKWLLKISKDKNFEVKEFETLDQINEFKNNNLIKYATYELIIIPPKKEIPKLYKLAQEIDSIITYKTKLDNLNIKAEKETIATRTWAQVSKQYLTESDLKDSKIVSSIMKDKSLNIEQKKDRIKEKLDEIFTELFEFKVHEADLMEDFSVDYDLSLDRAIENLEKEEIETESNLKIEKEAQVRHALRLIDRQLPGLEIDVEAELELENNKVKGIKSLTYDISEIMKRIKNYVKETLWAYEEIQTFVIGEEVEEQFGEIGRYSDTRSYELSSEIFGEIPVNIYFDVFISKSREISGIEWSYDLKEVDVTLDESFDANFIRDGLENFIISQDLRSIIASKNATNLNIEKISNSKIEIYNFINKISQENSK